MYNRIFKTGSLTQIQLESVFKKLAKWKIKYKYYEELKLITIDFSDFRGANPNEGVLVDYFASKGCSLNAEEFKKARLRIMAYKAMSENKNIVPKPNQKLKELLFPVIQTIITEYYL